MRESVAGGRYRVTWRDNQWVVRAPDGRTVERFGPTKRDNAAAHVWADRANAKLNAVDKK